MGINPPAKNAILLQVECFKVASGDEEGRVGGTKSVDPTECRME